MPHVLDDDTVTVLTALSSSERSFVDRLKAPRQRYLRALYLKAMQHLGHANYEPGALPRQLRLGLIEIMDLSVSLASVRTIDKAERSRVLGPVRDFLGLRKPTTRERDATVDWLCREVAAVEDDPTVVNQAAIERFNSTGLELVRPGVLNRIVHKAIARAEADVIDRIHASLDRETRARLDGLVVADDGRTGFERLKIPSPQATANNLARELERLDWLQRRLPHAEPPGGVSRRKVSTLGEVGASYTAAEIRQLRAPRRQTLLWCFVMTRYGILLDAAAHMLQRVWNDTKVAASSYANDRQTELTETHERYQEVLRALLEIIVRNPSEQGLWRAIRAYKDPAALAALYEELQSALGWTAHYVSKIEDHYTTLRRFLPELYSILPVCSTTMDDSLPQALRFAGKHAVAGSSSLPTKGCPTGFLSPPWTARAIQKRRGSKAIIRVHKIPYELGLIEATTSSLKDGTLAIPGAQRYGPLSDHLLPRDEFLSCYEEHLRRLNLPAKASEYYDPLRDKLREKTHDFDKQYDAVKTRFWVQDNGTLGYSRLKGERRFRKKTKLQIQIAAAMPQVSVLDVLLDCQRWTRFLDHFKATSGRQNMTRDDWLRHSLAALYAYGCYCGPTQAARALGLSEGQVMYMRRRFMKVAHLRNAANTLEEAYQRTAMAARLGSPGVVLCDAMQLRTLKRSLIARQHHRYRDGKSTLLYQHVASNCVCLFTQALLCNVSEAIHLLSGALECRRTDEPIINICDSGGKSNLTFGLAPLLNIILYPRVRSRHLHLWGADPKAKYDKIGDAIAGQIQWDLIERGWKDVVWVLASISAGTAKPVALMERLASQPKNPASLALEELGKLERSIYLLDYGMDLDMRRFVIPYTSRREHWNKFTREVMAFGGLLRDKTLESQEQVFWFLTVVQNAIVLWNALALEHVLGELKIAPNEAQLAHMLPTLTEHINFVGLFDLDLRRRPPFRFRVAS